MKKVMLRIFSVFGICTFVQVSAFAANDCSKEDNDAIAAEFALCSTHVYNIGETQNQDGADRDLMRDVIAMKTTVMTQQLYKQYEQMESVLQRFKTQLEKAVLADTLKAAGAKSERQEEEKSFKSTTPNVYVEDMENCAERTSYSDMFDCLQQNYARMSSVSGNVSIEYRKQLATDYQLAVDNIENVGGANNAGEDFCKKYKNMTQKKDGKSGFDYCKGKLLDVLREANSKLDEKERNSNNWTVFTGGRSQ